MIDVKTKIHDKFSIEFKVRFEGDESLDCDTSKRGSQSQFAINTWIFIPGSLDVNSSTYDKLSFHRDVKSNIRLITPAFTLEELVADDHYAQLTSLAEEEITFQLKLAAAIFKSAMRNEADRMAEVSEEEMEGFRERVCCLLNRFRQLKSRLPESAQETFAAADEFMSHIAELQSLRLLNVHKDNESLRQLVADEQHYKKEQGYAVATLKGDNTNLIAHHSLLKKHIESPLYLRVDTEKDGKAVEQFWLGVAAGIAMLVSTAVALPFQHYWSNYPTFIFIILVVAYMLKDRTKEFFRGLFSNQLKNRYFDQRTEIRLKDRKLGWIKESVDFVNAAKVPASVMKLRNRGHLEQEGLAEQILFYRKRVQVDNSQLHNQQGYCFEGIHDIMRFHLHNFTTKMDDPTASINTLDEEGRLVTMEVPRTYTFHIVMQFLEQKSLNTEQRLFKITATRDGICSVEMR